MKKIIQLKYLFYLSLFTVILCSGPNRKKDIYRSIAYTNYSYGNKPKQHFLKDKSKGETILLTGSKSSFYTWKYNIFTGTFIKDTRYATDELLNAFPVKLPNAKSGSLEILSEVAKCPWNPENQLAMVTVYSSSEEVNKEEKKTEAKNLVIAIDTSGSMATQRALTMARQNIIEYIRGKNLQISLIEYKDNSKIILSGQNSENRSSQIIDELMQLKEDGGTNAWPGINLAFKEANYLAKNREKTEIIFFSDGDFGGTNIIELDNLLQKNKKIQWRTIVYQSQESDWHEDNKEVHEKLNVQFVRDGFEGIQVLGKENISKLENKIIPTIDISINENAVEDYRIIGFENVMVDASKKNSSIYRKSYTGLVHHFLIEFRLKPEGISKEMGTLKVGVIDTTISTPTISDKQEGYKILQSSKDPFDATEYFRFGAGVAMFNKILNNELPSNTVNYYKSIHLLQDAISYDPDGQKKIFLKEITSQKSSL